MARHPDPARRSRPLLPVGTPIDRRERAAGFARNRDGTITILFAFLLLPLLMMLGVAIDYGLATRLETKLQAATDATALLLCQTPLTATDAELNALARTTMTGQMGNGVVVDPLTITTGPRRILLNTHASLAVFFGGITGTRTITPGAQAQCATPIPKSFEIALVLDTTGSMSKAGNDGVTKLAALKSAAQKFVAYVLSNPSFAQGTKIAIVPFSSAVAVDPTAYASAPWVDTEGQAPTHWTNFSGMSEAGFKSRFGVFSKLAAVEPSWKWAGCFESQPYPQNVTDMATNGPASLYVPYLAPDEGGPGRVGGYYTYFPSYWNLSYNSYIDDDDGTDDGTCPKQSASYPKAQARGCKYKNPHNARPGATLGIPNGPNFGCTSQPLQRLTRQSVVLSTLIDKMTASGSTNIHEGLMWGWRTISPKSVFADGSAYGDDKVGKIIVLMTDGANSWTENPSSYNGSLASSNGYFRNADGSNADSHFPAKYQGISTSDAARNGLDALTRLACDNAKASPANVAIYTIGFSVSSDPIDAQGIQLLKDCASSPSQYFPASDSGSLIAAFNQIAASLGRLRLTQ